MKVRATSASIWRISYPLVAAGVSETVVDVTDAIFLGHYGVTELGAVGLADALYGVLLVAVIALGDGLQVMLARRAGQGNPKAVGAVFNQGVAILAVAAAAVFVIVRFGSPWLVSALFGSSDVERAVNEYLEVAAYRVPFDAMNLLLVVFFVAVSKTRVLIGGALVVAMTNVALDYCLIFGNLGAPRLGIAGAAAATVAAEAGALTFFLLYAWRRGYLRRHGLFIVKGWNRHLARILMTLSLPIAGEALVETIRWFAFFAIIERLGEEALAGANIVYSYYAVFLIPAESFGETACSMVSNLIGQDKWSRVRWLLKRSIGLGFVLTLPMLVPAALLSRQALLVFTSEPSVIAIAAPSMLVVVAIVTLAIPAEVLLGAVIGTGRTRAVLVIEIVMTTTVLALGSFAAFALDAGLAWIWGSLLAGWLARLALSGVALGGGDRSARDALG